MKKQTVQSIELLAPAGNFEKLRFALLYGADAVYIGGTEFSLRARADNFTLPEISDAVRLCHANGKKLYMALNVFARNEDLSPIQSCLSDLRDIGIDGLIVSDPGVIRLCRRIVPEIPLHLSTQANTTNRESALFWRDIGIRRVNLARELSRAELREIASISGLETEMFIHGAMCMSYSGRCLISSYLTGRDANRGDCAQPCRWEYNIVASDRPEEVYTVEEDRHGTYFFNSADLNLLPFIAEIVDLGISAVKIEGRMKSSFYVASVTRVYRKALDLAVHSPEMIVQKIPCLADELEMVSHRRYSHGFYTDATGNEAVYQKSSGYSRKSDFVGVVEGCIGRNGEYEITISARGKFCVGDRIEILSPDIDRDITMTVRRICDERRHDVGFTKPNARYMLIGNKPVMENSLVRKVAG